MAYDKEGTVDKAAYSMGISSRQFGKLWKELVGIGMPKKPAKSKKKAKLLQDSDATYKVAFISDLHLGSNYQCLDELEDFCNRIRRQGVETLVCLGDLSDGLKMHADMDDEQFLHKAPEILDYIADNYPRGFKTNVFITGNHDRSLEKHGCLKLGEALVERREDLIFAGHDAGYITIDGGLRVYLHHGTGGCSVERSKRLQGLADQLVETSAENLPHVLALGHCHNESVIPTFKGMMCISMGCFQEQTPYLRKRGLHPDISGIVLSYKIVKGYLENPTIEFMDYNRR